VEAAQRVSKLAFEESARLVLAFSALQRGDLLQAEEQALWALRMACDLDQTLSVLSGVETVGLVASRKGHAEKSARLLGAVAALREAVGLVADPLWHKAVEAMVAPGREVLGKEQWAAAFQAGRALTLEEAVAEALEESSPG
jgi:hypothetical protein